MHGGCGKETVQALCPNRIYAKVTTLQVAGYLCLPPDLIMLTKMTEALDRGTPVPSSNTQELTE